MLTYGTLLVETAFPLCHTAVVFLPELFCNLFTSRKCCSHGWIYENNDLTDCASLQIVKFAVHRETYTLPYEMLLIYVRGGGGWHCELRQNLRGGLYSLKCLRKIRTEGYLFLLLHSRVLLCWHLTQTQNWLKFCIGFHSSMLMRHGQCVSVVWQWCQQISQVEFMSS